MKITAYQEPVIELALDKSSSIAYIEHGPISDLIRWHCHEEYELHIVVSSDTGKVFIGDFVGDFSLGHIVLTGPNLPHNWVSDGENCELYASKTRDKVIKFSQSVFDRLCEVTPELRDLAILLSGSSCGFEFDSAKVHIYEPMFNAIRDSEGADRVANLLNLLQVLVQDERRVQLSTQEYNRYKPANNVHLINEAIQFIGRNYMRTLSLREVSEHVGMSSPSSFSRFFYKASGINYIEFVKKLRVSKACEKLERSNDQITQICFDVGFANVANFNRHFLSLKGMTPSQYRESSQQKFKVN